MISEVVVFDGDEPPLTLIVPAVDNVFSIDFTEIIQGPPGPPGPSSAPPLLKNANYTFVMADAGATILHTSGSAHTYTIPSNITVPFPPGTLITIVNDTAAGNITLSADPAGGNTLKRGDGVAGTGSRTITANSMVTIEKTQTFEWFISGTFT